METAGAHVVQLVGYQSGNPLYQVYLGALQGIPMSGNENIVDLGILQFDTRSNTWMKRPLTNVKMCGEKVVFDLPTWWHEMGQGLSVFNNKNEYAQQWKFTIGATPEKKEGVSGTLAPGVGHYIIDLLRRHKPYHGQ